MKINEIFLMAFLAIGMITSASAVESQSYSSVGNYTYTLPSDAVAVNVTIAGAEGGGGEYEPDGSYGGGGDGGKATFSFPVQGGTVLELGVGEAGQSDVYGGGGGGSSAIRYDSNNSLVACATGGGGDGSNHGGGDGGGGDGAAGQELNGDGTTGGSGGTGFFSDCPTGGSGGWYEDGSPGSIEYFTSDYTEYSTGTNTVNGSVSVTAIYPNSPPSASFILDSPVNPGEDFGLDASGSSDPDGDVLSYEWDTDNDGDFDDATGVSPSVSKSELGTYTVRLRVTDSSGASSTKEINQFVEDSVPPVTTDDYTLDGWQERDSTSIELSASDAVSEVDSISYRVDGGSFTEVSGDSATVEIMGSGNNTLEYFATDNKGNEESMNTEYVAMYSSDDDSTSLTVDYSEEKSGDTVVQRVIDSVKSFVESILSVVG